MMSLYADFLKEYSDIEILEKEYGFATYSISGEECYIRDVYVIPVMRNKNYASLLADEITKIAKDKGCKYLTGSVKKEV
jgi:GNAT superfamily N-acetyltransferase